MNTTTTLQQLITSDIDIISQTAKQFQRYESEYISGQISQDEYNELVTDLTRLEQIDKQMFNIRVYTKIVEAFEYLSAIKNLASLL